MASMSKVSVRKVTDKSYAGGYSYRRFPEDWELVAGEERAKFWMKGYLCEGINVYRTGKGTFVATKGSHGPVVRGSKSNSPRNAIGKALKSLGCTALRGKHL